MNDLRSRPSCSSVPDNVHSESKSRRSHASSSAKATSSGRGPGSRVTAITSATHSSRMMPPTTARITRRSHVPGRALDPARQLEVGGREPAGVVRAQRDAHLAVADVEVGVVVGRLRERGDPAHEVDRLHERRELVDLHDLVTLAATSPAAGSVRHAPRRRSASDAPRPHCRPNRTPDPSRPDPSRPDPSCGSNTCSVTVAPWRPAPRPSESCAGCPTRRRPSPIAGQLPLFGPGPDREIGKGEFRGLEFVHVRARTIVNRVDARSPMPFRFTINAYRGCSHACTYCFARPTHEYLGLDIRRPTSTA